MAETTRPVLSVIATTRKRLPDLAIKNAQLIFVRDAQTIAFDFGGVRTFYNQVITVQTEAERNAIETPQQGLFYFVVESAILWTYENGWVQVTTRPEDVVCIGTEFPELGNAKTLYVNKKEKHISVWDVDSTSYVTVGNVSTEMTEEDIDKLFV